ncbi:hypothetical protein PTTG_08629 [Puccinia triticina 1-1 BBBD Race 1]|uniref:Secreted protein n=1 Tax=Puccinia triticina (isolate 1-1 / race 1 (BBBD)) TaxID=630390 RepID=A0A0C4F665_PUCT1|nr:hypothetical protein PTTG_08629 [Puccinia triticina 1-1 BBBD Race 1]
MPAFKTLFAFIFVVSALAGLASAAPAPAVNQLACDGTPAPTQPTKRSAVNQLACDGTPAPTQPTKRSAVNQLACDGTPAPTQPTKRSTDEGANVDKAPHAVNQLACGDKPEPATGNAGTTTGN